MTIENEQTKTVSNAQLLVDIANTQLEKEAYEKLAAGYAILSKLPENQETGQSNLHWMQVRKNEMLAGQCDVFLTKLLASKADRGLS
jgi:hypothetical protein